MRRIRVISNQADTAERVRAALPEAGLVHGAANFDGAAGGPAPEVTVVAGEPAEDAAAIDAWRRSNPGGLIVLGGVGPSLAACIALPEDAVATELRHALTRALAQPHPRPQPAPAPAPATTRSESKYRTALRGAVRLLAVPTHDHAAQWTQLAIDVFSPVSAGMLMPRGAYAGLEAPFGIAADVAAAFTLPMDAGLMAALAERRALMEAGRDAEGNVLRVLGLCWAAPLHANGELAGALCLGPRADGEPYDAADRELFMLLAEAASSAMTKTASMHEAPSPPFEPSPAPSEPAGPSPGETWEAAAARIAQAMQNPLSTIAAYAQMLPQNYASADFRTEMSETVQREVERISAVVETLHGASLLPRINLQAASVNDAVRRALKWVESEIHEHMIQLDEDLDPAEPQAILDSAYLVDALRQLLRNAIEAMPQGGALRVGTRMTEGGCEIRVADSGAGLNGEAARQIFQPFYSTKPYRLGLGLTVAQRIVEAHRGRLRHENTGGGSRFSLSLPSTKED